MTLQLNLDKEDYRLQLSQPISKQVRTLKTCSTSRNIFPPIKAHAFQTLITLQNHVMWHLSGYTFGTPPSPDYAISKTSWK